MNLKLKFQIAKILKFIGDKKYLKILYFLKTRKRLSINNPLLFNEKLNWIKLNIKDDLMTLCVDKYNVREYIKSNNYDNILPKLYGCYDNFNDINFDLLPNKFVIKTTHGSSQNIFVHDKNSLNIDKARRKLITFLSNNQFFIGREWPYKNVKPRIIIEEYLVDKKTNNSNGINDYKFFCFNGRPEFVQVDIDRFTNHKRNFFDLNWKFLEMSYVYSNTLKKIPRPYNMSEMTTIAKKLSFPFLFCRIDFYEVNKIMYFGEITFFPENAMAEFKPKILNMEIGNLLNLK
jgi:hypothetical protein